MKLAIFAFVSSAYVAYSTEIAGSLAVTYASNIVTIKGSLTGLPKSVTDAGIHVHSGEDCTNGGKTTAGEVNTHVGGHLYSNYIDGWAYPAPITYNSDSTGKADIDVSAKYFVLAKDQTTDAKPYIEGRCIVIHGVSSDAMGDRAAIGKIQKNGDAYTATIGKYPGPNALTSTPAGTLTVTVSVEGVATLKGTLTGLGKSLTNAGIHIHTGTDCTGGSDLTTKTAVNAVIGGHLYSQGDGFLTTKYSSNDQGAGFIDIATPASAYTLLNTDATNLAPAVENHCIVIHDGAGARVGIGQIKCTEGSGSCAATIGAYPTPAATTTTNAATTTTNAVTTTTNAATTTKPTTTAGDEINAATQLFTTFSALVVGAALAF